MPVWVSIVIVVLLILIEALFVAAEIALVSLRESQVTALAAAGKRGHAVQRLISNPNRFLASVQIGVTLTSLLSSAFGAVTLSDQLGDTFGGIGLGGSAATVLGFLVVTLAISYVTLVVGELAPKRLGLQRAERTAQLVAPSLERIATASRPLIWLLSKSTDGVVRLLGGNPATTRQAISEEELRGMVAAQESLTADERQLIDEVFAAGERAVREVMVPRTEVDFLDAALSITRAAEIAAASSHSRFPVVRGSYDDVAGFVHVRDLFATPVARRTAKVGDIVREAKLLPATKKVIAALSELRREGHHLAIVVDEYGGTAGIVTLEDLIEEIIGDIRDEYDVAAGELRRLGGGDVEVDGLLNLDEFAEQTGAVLLDGPYETVAGYIMAGLGHLPRLGDAVEADGHRLTVTAMDGRRISRVRVSAIPAADAEPAQAEVG